MDFIELSRLQFGATALYHFFFVPLTLGLSVLLAIMETVYVMTGKEIWKRMVKFWGLLFGINFAMGVATGLPLEFQFGTNWAHYSQYVGDVFGALLAYEGLMAFFLEATFVGLFFFGWNRLSKVAHMTVTWLLALGTNFSALWILIANAWMQNPTGAAFNIDTLRMEMTSFYEVFFNPVAQSKFVHTISAGYVTGAVFVLAISAYYLLRGRNIDIAKRSMTVAASFGLASALSVVILGDESGYTLGLNQKMKLAGIEALWEEESPPASLIAIGWPKMEKKEVDHAVHIPWALGLIATRSFDEPVHGINYLLGQTKGRIIKGLVAFAALERLKKDKKEGTALQTDAIKAFRDNQENLGYALLLKKFMKGDITQAGPHEIQQAAELTVPNVPVLFFAFRVMVALGFFFIALFGLSFYLAVKRRLHVHRAYLWVALWALPLPWIAAELGWIIAEYGRQPWIIAGVLPTFLGASSVSATSVWITLTAFVTFYTGLLFIDIFLMRKYIKLGPESIFPEHKNQFGSGAIAQGPSKNGEIK